MVLLLLSDCLSLLLLFFGDFFVFGTCFIVFCCAVLSVISSFAVILQGKEERASCFTVMIFYVM